MDDVTWRGGGERGDGGPDPAEDEDPGLRHAAPDPLAPIDPHAPVSGHSVPSPDARDVSLAPEHDWSAAAGLILPLLRPAGTSGLDLARADAEQLLAAARQSSAQPIVDDGPCGLRVVYALPASGFDVIVNGEHVLSWGVGPDAIREAALRNLATWSGTTGWTAESSEGRRLIASDSGGGWDASRILLPEVRDYLVAELGPARILVGLPDRHLLLAGGMAAGDTEFAVLFHQFVTDQFAGSDEPIDGRIFELADGRLAELDLGT